MALAPEKKPVHTFTIPPKLAQAIGVRNIGIREQTAEMELDAARASRGNAANMGFDLALRCLAEIDGSPVSLVDGSAEQAWSKLGPKGRQLAMTAYSAVNNLDLSDDEAASFLASRAVSV